MELVLQGDELQGANVVRKLVEPIGPWRHVFIDNCVFGKRVLDCGMECLGDDGLVVVVIDLYFIEGLQVREVVEEEQNQVMSGPM